MEWQQHIDEDVQQALIRLCDALCSWERNTGRRSILILREQDFCFRADSGKPISSSNDDLSDAHIVAGLYV